MIGRPIGIIEGSPHDAVLLEARNRGTSIARVPRNGAVMYVGSAFELRPTRILLSAPKTFFTFHKPGDVDSQNVGNPVAVGSRDDHAGDITASGT